MDDSRNRNMKVAVVVAAACMALTSCANGPGRADAACADRKNEQHKLTIVLKDGKPEKVEKQDGKSDELHACPGDDIRWKLKDDGFEIQFVGRDPFDWGSASHKAKPIDKGVWALSDVVSSNAPRGVPLKYSVTVRGNTLDPKIIVDN
ncbi:MAG: hypothetical protein FIB04_10030 [Gammaproteobacteria bacterium]|nr:hypothetical protein [Gammaproteobacteria bacterium]